MCQCLCCDCWWCNFGGVPCGGIHLGLCLCSFWMCKPIELQTMDPDFCKLCAFDGLGSNLCCIGSICCASDFVRMWSKKLSSGPVGITNVVVSQIWLIFSIYTTQTYTIAIYSFRVIKILFVKEIISVILYLN